MPAYPLVDLALARRLERAEATANAAFVDARAQLEPHIGATWIDVAGAYAMFDGVGSPLTQTFGLGLFDPFLDTQLRIVEEFFDSRGASTVHEASSFTPTATMQLIRARGYTAVEESVVLVKPTITDSSETNADVTVRLIDESESRVWARVSAEGWSSEGDELTAFVESLGLVSARARGIHCFIAEADGQPVAAAALSLAAGIALLAGASTVPTARRRGAQRALLQTRLGFAQAQGFDLAMIVTQPASASQRNAERQGFRAAYSRTKWERRASAHA